MDTITIPVKEYKRLLGIKRFPDREKKTRGFIDAAFGILKDGFEKESSISYVANLRKSWRK